MKYFAIMIIVASFIGCSSSFPPLNTKGYSKKNSNAVNAIISVNKSEFDLVAGDEIDITFRVINQTSKPVPSEPLRDTTRLKINGKILSESQFLFSNGIHDGRDILPPEEEMLFLYRLTSYFSKEGTYIVSWHGDYFDTEAIVFSVKGKITLPTRSSTLR